MEGYWEKRYTASVGLEDGEPYYIHSRRPTEQSWTEPQGFCDEDSAADIESVLSRVTEDMTLGDVLNVVGWGPPMNGHVKRAFASICLFSNVLLSGCTNDGEADTAAIQNMNESIRNMRKDALTPLEINNGVKTTTTAPIASTAAVLNTGASSASASSLSPSSSSRATVDPPTASLYGVPTLTASFDFTAAHVALLRLESLMDRGGSSGKWAHLLLTGGQDSILGSITLLAAMPATPPATAAVAARLLVHIGTMYSRFAFRRMIDGSLSLRYTSLLGGVKASSSVEPTETVVKEGGGEYTVGIAGEKMQPVTAFFGMCFNGIRRSLHLQALVETVYNIKTAQKDANSRTLAAGGFKSEEFDLITTLLPSIIHVVEEERGDTPLYPTSAGMPVSAMISPLPPSRPPPPPPPPSSSSPSSSSSSSSCKNEEGGESSPSAGNRSEDKPLATTDPIPLMIPQGSRQDVDSVHAWLTLLSHVCSYAAGALYREKHCRKSDSAASFLLMSLSPNFTEEGLPWSRICTLLLQLTSSSTSPGLTSGGTSHQRKLAEILARDVARALSSLHRLWEVSLLDADMSGFDCPAASTRSSPAAAAAAATAVGGGGVARKLDAFGVISPIVEAFAAEMLGAREGRDSKLVFLADICAHLVHDVTISSAGSSADASKNSTRPSATGSSNSAASESSSSAAASINVSSSSSTPSAVAEDGDSDDDIDSDDIDDDDDDDDDASVAHLTAAVSGRGPKLASPAYRGKREYSRYRLFASLSLLTALFELPALAPFVLFSTDLQVLIDVALRELRDLPLREFARISWLKLIRAIVMNSQWREDAFKASELAACASSLCTPRASFAEGLLPEIRASAEELLQMLCLE